MTDDGESVFGEHAEAAGLVGDWAPPEEPREPEAFRAAVAVLAQIARVDAQQQAAAAAQACRRAQEALPPAAAVRLAQEAALAAHDLAAELAALTGRHVDEVLRDLQDGRLPAQAARAGG